MLDAELDDELDLSAVLSTSGRIVIVSRSTELLRSEQSC
jgi:hypothetical protein